MVGGEVELRMFTSESELSNIGNGSPTNTEVIIEIANKGNTI